MIEIRTFVIMRDIDPRPWENWSQPYKVVVSTREYADSVCDKLQAAHPTHQYSLSECVDGVVDRQILGGAFVTESPTFPEPQGRRATGTMRDDEAITLATELCTSPSRPLENKKWIDWAAEKLLNRFTK